MGASARSDGAVTAKFALKYARVVGAWDGDGDGAEVRNTEMVPTETTPPGTPAAARARSMVPFACAAARSSATIAANEDGSKPSSASAYEIQASNSSVMLASDVGTMVPEGAGVGGVVGTAVGCVEGVPLGAPLGVAVGTAVGTRVGAPEGEAVEGPSVGAAVDGAGVGAGDGGGHAQEYSSLFDAQSRPNAHSLLPQEYHSPSASQRCAPSTLE